MDFLRLSTADYASASAGDNSSQIAKLQAQVEELQLAVASLVRQLASKSYIHPEDLDKEHKTIELEFAAAEARTKVLRSEWSAEHEGPFGMNFPVKWVGSAPPKGPWDLSGVVPDYGKIPPRPTLLPITLAFLIGLPSNGEATK
jgi:hypothetical protein